MDQIPQLKTAITALSSASAQAALSAEEPVAAFDSLSTLGGDFLAPSLLSSIDHGRGMVAVMNAVPIDVVCFGNHECDVPFDSMVQRVNEFKGGRCAESCLLKPQRAEHGVVSVRCVCLRKTEPIGLVASMRARM
eukprot:6198081-Pleurochrysis_carterae.AAC.2